MKPKVLLTEPIPNSLQVELQNHVDLTIGKRGFFNIEDNLVKTIGLYDGLISMLSNPVTEPVINAGKSLKVIANYAVGYNNVHVETANLNNIKVANTPDVLTDSTADGIMALMLATVRNIPQANDFVRTGKFDGWDPNGFLGMGLSGKKLGIVGLGRIGKAVCKRAKSFGLTIYYLNRNPLPSEQETELEVQYVSNIKELASISDILCLTCPLNDETYHLMNKDIFKLMKNSSALNNGARGPVINEKDLFNALTAKTISAAGLDVYEFEPKIYPGLAELNNCVLLPHIASATFEARSAMGALSTGAVLNVLKGLNYPCHFIN